MHRNKRSDESGDPWCRVLREFAGAQGNISTVDSTHRASSVCRTCWAVLLPFIKIPQYYSINKMN